MSPSPKLSLLGLTLEIRNKINRYLLLNARPIGYVSRFIGGTRSDDREWYEWDAPPRFDVAILRTSHQLNAEGCAILYGENPFGRKIQAGDGEERAEFPGLKRRLNHIAQSSVYGFPVDRIKRYHIVVEAKCDNDIHCVRSSVRNVCMVLSENPTLQRLDIVLEMLPLAADAGELLQPFSLLRNLNKVSFKNVPPIYAQQLKTSMEGNEPLDHFMRYEVLENNVGEFSSCSFSLRTMLCVLGKEDSVQHYSHDTYGKALSLAEEAMEEGDAERLEYWGNAIITAGEARMALAKHSLVQRGWKVGVEDSEDHQIATKRQH